MSGFRCAHILQEVDSSTDFVDYYAAFTSREYSFLLESGMDPEKLGRFSFAGRDPFLVFKSKRDRVEVIQNGKSEIRQGDPFTELRATLAPYRIDPSQYRESKLPFLGGAVGYFGYELGYAIEELPCRGVDDLALPDCCFMFFDAILAYDHLEQQLYVSAVGFDTDSERALARAQQAFDSLRGEMRQVELGATTRSPAVASPVEAVPAFGSECEIRSMFDQNAYMDVVQQAKEHIFAGDIFEVCTTHRLETDFDGDAFELYRTLRAINPAPFASFLNLPEVKVVSSSPERFMRLQHDGWCESRPIKGTRPRGKDDREDRTLHRDLSSSIKDQAENVMIVDLVRSDFGRVCEFGSVGVSELMIVEKYATVFQMVSTIVGKLEPDRDVFDLVRASFPGGSMTGAPKIEAMSIIDALEPVKRGIYSGSIGYLDFAGNADLNIVIRTILVKDGKAYFQVGGAVTADSDPKEEYIESMDKARALIRALRSVSGAAAQVGPGRDARSSS